MLHELKLREEYWEAVMGGMKSFEIRNNDRGFQKGDQVVFKKVDKLGVRGVYPSKKFDINYVLNGWGLKEGHVAFSISPSSID